MTAIQRIEANTKNTDKRPPWQRALAAARLPLYDVHWTTGVVVEKPTGKKGEALCFPKQLRSAHLIVTS